MAGVQGLPEGSGVGGEAFGEFGGSHGELAVQAFHHFAEGAELVQELGAVREQDAAEKRAGPRRSLAAQALKVRWVQRGSIGDGAVVFGMFAERAHERGKRLGETSTQSRGDADRLKGFCHVSAAMQFHSFIERYTEHGVSRFELLRISVKCLGLLVRQPSMPVLADGGTSTWEGTVVGFQRLVSPGEQRGEYTKKFA